MKAVSVLKIELHLCHFIGERGKKYEIKHDSLIYITRQYRPRPPISIPPVSSGPSCLVIPGEGQS